MTSIVKLEALSGVKDDGPLCYLLQVDESFILLDCGWNESFNLDYLQALKPRISQISAVLLSYADPAHLGALPYLVAKCGLTAPIYATVPVFKMGQMFMYDWVNGHQNVEDFTLFTLDDVDTAFDRVQQVKYNQTILLKGDNGIQFTPLPAGHMIGGAIWKISKQGDEEIVYAVDFNHKKERHLNGCVFDAISRPHLLITDAYNALYSQPKRRDRDEEMVTKMLTTVRGGGDCLVVIDTAGRVLEIAHLLDQLWSNSDAGLMSYNLVMLSHVATTVVDFAKSQVEWMSDKILKSFESGRYNPFAFRNVQLCHSQLELSRVRSPKVVLCSGPEMESGFSRELFLEWSSDTRNMIILTSRSEESTLASKLIKMFDTTSNRNTTPNKQLQLEVKRRIRLDGVELENFRKAKFEKEQEAARIRMEQSRLNARLGMSQDDDDDDSDDDEALANAVAAVTGIKQNSAVNGVAINGTGPPGLFSTPGRVDLRRQSSIGLPSTPATANQLVPSTPGGILPGGLQPTAALFDCPHDLMVKWEHQQKAAFFKASKKTYPMYPYVEEKVKWDDYGEVIRPEEYITAESIVPQVSSSDDSEDRKPDAGGSQSLTSADGSAPAAPVPVVEEWPTKCVSYTHKLEVLCKVEFIDFEGRSDGESIKKILAQIRPRQLIIVHGSPAATRHLMQYATDNHIVTQRSFAPRLGEVIDATVETRIYQVSLSDAVMSQLFFQSAKEADLAWVDARIVRRQVAVGAGSGEEVEEKENEESADKQKEQKSGEEPMEVDGDVPSSQPVTRVAPRRRPDTFLLDVLPANSIPSHNAVFVNDPKLTDLKELLQKAGFKATFNLGVLTVDGVATIRRHNTDGQASGAQKRQFQVEGCAGLQYYKIRDFIYQQFAIV